MLGPNQYMAAVGVVIIPKPPNKLLSEYANLDVWDLAEKQAYRSPFKLFKTGAVLLNGKGSVVSKGCSHVREHGSPRPSIHAEAHALYDTLNTAGLTCLIVTINKSGNWACSSKPCAYCTHVMNKAGIERVIYAERTNDGEWSVNVERIEHLILRVDCDMIHEKYTKQMRLIS